MTNRRSATEPPAGGLQLVSLQRRFAALLINIVLGLATFAAVMGAIVALVILWQRRSADEPSPAPGEPGAGPLGAAFGGEQPGAQATRPVAAARAVADRLRSPPVKLGLSLLSMLLAGYGKERRGLGYRLLGLRLVDARGGGPPSRRQRILRAAIREIWQATHRRLVPPPTPAPESAADQAKLRAEIEAARRRHEDDQEALQMALSRIFRENRPDPVSVACLPLLARLPLIVAINLPMPWSPLGQSLVDWLSGTVVVVDRAQSARPSGRG